MKFRYSIGILAVIISFYFILQGRESTPFLIASLFLLVITITDTVYTKIPNIVNLSFLGIGLTYYFIVNGPSGLLTALIGCLAGFGMLFPGYFFRLVGAGDVKALAVLGTLIGSPAILQVFIYMSLIGGVIAILYYLSNRNIIQTAKKLYKSFINFAYTKDINCLIPKISNIRFPYAVAIAFGYFAYINWGNII